MYKKDFDALLAKGLDAKSYLFYGNEPYYIQKYGNLVANTLTTKENRLLFYYDEYEFESAKNYLSQASLFGDTNLLVIKHDKQIPAKELKTLIEICKKTPNSYFIYEFYGNDGKRAANYFQKKSNALEVRFFQPTENEALKELHEKAKSYNIEIDHSTLRHLYLLVEENLSLAARELEKLSVFKTVGTKEVDQLVYPLTDLHYDKLYKAILLKEPLGELFSKIEEQDILQILLGLERYIKDLFLFYSYIRLNGKADAKEILGYTPPKSVVEERVRLAIKIKNYPDIFLTLQECEYRLKTATGVDKISYFFSCLMKIQALI